MDPRTIARDACVLAGAGLICYGAWLLSHPWGFVVGGLAMLAIAVLLARSE